jgi:methylase of polypeptide subunit release factors
VTRQKELGDFQTPPALAEDILARLQGDYRTIVEPNCGVGAFLSAAAKYFDENTALHGFDLNPAHLEIARANIPRAQLLEADFFERDWKQTFAALPDPILVVGNPPWVTNADQGKRGSINLPQKTNFQKQKGLDARTGRANFDISEYMLLHLLDALTGRRARLAMLVKTSVARRVLLHAWRNNIPLANSALYTIDAKKHFDVTTSACLFVTDISQAPEYFASSHESLDGPPAPEKIALIGDNLVSDASAYEESKSLLTNDGPRWRSGIKHDAAKILELTEVDGILRNQLGEIVDVEPARLFPLLKATDLHLGKTTSRYLLLPQLEMREDTRALAEILPRTHAYLSRHEAAFAKRKSSIYVKRPQYAVFGLGEYTFSAWKVAISGLHKSFEPRAVGPRNGRPVMLDDTCYFLPCDSEEHAGAVLRAFSSAPAQRLLRSMIFWDAKRPITAEVLRRLDLDAAAIYAPPV